MNAVQRLLCIRDTTIKCKLFCLYCIKNCLKIRNVKGYSLVILCPELKSCSMIPTWTMASTNIHTRHSKMKINAKTGVLLHFRSSVLEKCKFIVLLFIYLLLFAIFCFMLSLFFHSPLDNSVIQYDIIKIIVGLKKTNRKYAKRKKGKF